MSEQMNLELQCLSEKGLHWNLKSWGWILTLPPPTPSLTAADPFFLQKNEDLAHSWDPSSKEIGGQGGSLCFSLKFLYADEMWTYLSAPLFCIQEAAWYPIHALSWPHHFSMSVPHPLSLSTSQYSYKYTVLPKSIFSVDIIMISETIIHSWAAWSPGIAFPFPYNCLFFQEFIVAYHEFFPHSPAKHKTNSIGFSHTY